MFLQLGETRAHRSVLYGAKFVKIIKEKWIHMTTCSAIDRKIDEVNHTVDPILVTTCKAELKVWGYLMMQYNLKPGLCKCGARVKAGAIIEMK